MYILVATNKEDLNEMPHNAAFHQDLHCLLRPNQSSEKEIQFYLEIKACEPLICTTNYPKFIESNRNLLTSIPIRFLNLTESSNHL